MILVAAAGSLALFGLPSCEKGAPPTKQVKKIIMKDAPVEQRMGFDAFANEPLRQKSVTVYYLVAEDGTVAEVGLSDYARTNVGDKYASYNWTTK